MDGIATVDRDLAVQEGDLKKRCWPSPDFAKSQT